VNEMHVMARSTIEQERFRIESSGTLIPLPIRILSSSLLLGVIADSLMFYSCDTERGKRSPDMNSLIESPHRFL
jgi:hypothetical protein